MSQELIEKPKKKTFAQWEGYIGTSLKKTAEATLETAKRIAEFKTATPDDQFVKKMKVWYQMSPAHLSYWAKIAESMPRFLEHTGKLPASTRTLYELSSVKDDLWNEFIETGDINPSLTVEGAKSLKVSGGFKKSTANKYAEADNFLEIMQELDKLMQESDSVIDAKKALIKWLKKNPPEYHEDEVETLEKKDSALSKMVDSKTSISTTEKVPGTSSQTRVKCLALFGIFVDKPIYDKDILTCLDKMAGSDELKLAAIATLEGE